MCCVRQRLSRLYEALCVKPECVDYSLSFDYWRACVCVSPFGLYMRRYAFVHLYAYECVSVCDRVNLCTYTNVFFSFYTPKKTSYMYTHIVFPHWIEFLCRMDTIWLLRKAHVLGISCCYKVNIHTCKVSERQAQIAAACFPFHSMPFQDTHFLRFVRFHTRFYGNAFTCEPCTHTQTHTSTYFLVVDNR